MISMAATEVLIVDNGLGLHLSPGTDRVERYLDQWCKELKTNIVVSILKITHYFRGLQSFN